MASPRRPGLLALLRRDGRRGPAVDRAVLRHGDPVTVAYVLFWCHALWACGLAFSGDVVVHLYDGFPLFRWHVWDGLAAGAAVLLRLGLRHADMRWVQAGAQVGVLVWSWAGAAFWLEFEGPSTALVYVALAAASAWVAYLTRRAWLDRRPPTVGPAR